MEFSDVGSESSPQKSAVADAHSLSTPRSATGRQQQQRHHHSGSRSARQSNSGSNPYMAPVQRFVPTRSPQQFKKKFASSDHNAARQHDDHHHQNSTGLHGDEAAVANGNHNGSGVVVAASPPRAPAVAPEEMTAKIEEALAERMLLVETLAAERQSRIKLTARGGNVDKAAASAANELKRLKQRLAALEQAKAKGQFAEHECERIQALLYERDAEFEGAKDACDRAERRAATLQACLGDAKKRLAVDLCRQRISGEVRIRSQLERKVESLQSEINTLTAQIDDASLSGGAMAQQPSSLSKSSGSGKASGGVHQQIEASKLFQEAEERLKQRRQLELMGLQEELSRQMRDDARSHEQREHSAVTELEQLQSRCANAEGTRASKLRDIAELKEQNNQCATLVAQHTAAASAAETDFSDMQQQRDDVATELKQQEATLRALQKHVTQELASSDLRASEAQQKYEAGLKEEQRQLQDQLRSIDEHVAAQRSENTKLLQRRDELKAQRDELKARDGELKARFAAVSERQLVARQQTDALNCDVKALREKKERREAELADINHAQAYSQKDVIIADLDGKLAKVQKQHAELETSHLQVVKKLKKLEKLLQKHNMSVD